MKRLNKAAESGSSPSPWSPSSEDVALLKRINAAKPGTLINVRMWTGECGSSHERHAKSITAAVKIIRQFSEFNANWSLEFISESNAEPPPADPRFARFGQAMWKYITKLGGDFCEYEISEDILPMAQSAGLCCRVKYDPDGHGENIEAEPGDEIWWWGDS